MTRRAAAQFDAYVDLDYTGCLMAKKESVHDKPRLLAACGLYCGACYHYRAAQAGGQRLLAEAGRRGRPEAGYTCQGCRSERRYVHAGCARCAIRACADARHLLHCGQCPELPCERLLAFRDDGRVHHRDLLADLAVLVELGATAWLDRQAERWRCACGQAFSWYEVECVRCGAALASYGADPTLG